MRDQFTLRAGACLGARPLGQYVESFGQHLAGLGYARKTIQSQLQLVAALDRWMARRHVSVADLDEGVVEGFLDGPRFRRRRPRGSASTVSRFLTHLRAHGAVIAPSPVIDESPWAQLERRYHHHLRAERGLSPTTVHT